MIDSSERRFEGEVGLSFVWGSDGERSSTGDHHRRSEEHAVFFTEVY